MDDVTKIRACLFGGAVGDALGAEIEFWSLERIRGRFPGSLTELPPYDGRAGRITYDTQMTLFTVEGLIRAVVQAQARGICAPEGVVHHGLLRWYRTQGGFPSPFPSSRLLAAAIASFGVLFGVPRGVRSHICFSRVARPASAKLGVAWRMPATIARSRRGHSGARRASAAPWDRTA